MTPDAHAPLRLAVDIGGTFTDIVLEQGATRITRKVLTTHDAPERAVLDGMGIVLKEAGLGFADISVFVHGTTLATNAIIERRGAVTALLATDGFRDILEIGTESRYDQYDLFLEKPKPLVPRSLRFTVPERIDADGGIVTPLDENAVRALVPDLKAKGVQALAIAFLHAYRNPVHERRAAEILKAEMPELEITMAGEVAPEIREFERTSTAVANAYVQPLMASYLKRMEAALDEAGFAGTCYLVTSGGGLTAIETARRFPVRLVESGPAGGAIFAAQFARRLGVDDLLSFDMGGTTAKICLIENAEPATSRYFEVDRAARFLKGSGLPLRIPVIEMVEIGAGGGSIAQVDSLMRVTVGPESASSTPGPACYGRGGDRPTVTDADLALGLIDPDGFAGGRMTLDRSAAEAALDRDVGTPLGLTPAHAAYAVHEIVCENMASAARVHAVEQGADLGTHAMIAFGGAAPLHAARVAQKLGMDRVIIPPNAGVGSAVGFLSAPVAFEVLRSRHVTIGRHDADEIAAMFDDMAAEARALVEPGAMGAPLVETRTAFMRYVGQGHEIAVTLDAGTQALEDAAAMRAAYETAYKGMFNRVIPDAEIEVMTWSALVSTIPAAPARVEPATARPAPDPVGRRQITLGQRALTVPVYDRTTLVPGARVTGPAIVTEDETASFLPEEFDLSLDASGCLIMDRRAASEQINGEAA
ncbi:Acetophenone carboxylase gamma subunit (plasmid) [Marinibacterium anthonyi]|nr:Acetophenone carboxylase gamma subunit [Marinibacterium anthonyi]